jgi:pyrroloquinoline quinone biosynthesis protein B
VRLKIVGSAAGGGFPQWNCNYRLSRAARAGVPGIASRTQSSLAASADGRCWVLFNASPDLRQQIAANPELQPSAEGPLRATPISAVVLTNADVDHIAGLLSLREGQAFSLYASEPVLAALEANPIFNVLDPARVKRRVLPSGPFEVRNADDTPTGLTIEAFPVPGKVALYLEDPALPDAELASDSGDTTGIRIFGGAWEGRTRAMNGGYSTAGRTSDAAGRGDDAETRAHDWRNGGLGARDRASAFYIPGCARIDERLRSRLAGASCLLFDGTVYTDDEMITAGVGTKTGARMGHLAMSGQDGSIAMLADVPIGRRVFVHINNTNPVLDQNSAEHAAVRAAGWEVGFDGMEVAL